MPYFKQDGTLYFLPKQKQNALKATDIVFLSSNRHLCSISVNHTQELSMTKSKFASNKIAILNNFLNCLYKIHPNIEYHSCTRHKLSQDICTTANTFTLLYSCTYISSRKRNKTGILVSEMTPNVKDEENI